MPVTTTHRSSLMRRLAGRHRPNDRGGVTAVVAILLAGGVLLGMGALVVDVGQLYAERQSLLGGADAGAMAAAHACASDPSCTTDTTSLASTAKAAADQSTTAGTPDATVLCGQKGGVQFGSSCGTTAGNLTGCVGPRPGSSGPNYVEISTTTRTTDGKTVLPPVFAETLMGSSYQGVTVSACSRVSWGSVGSMANSFPLMISKCAWQKATGNGNANNFAPPPGPGWNPANSLAVDLFADPAKEGCPQDTQGSLADLLGWTANLTCVQQLSTGDQPMGMSLSFLGGIPAGLFSFFCGIQKLLTWLGGLINQILNGSFTPQVQYLPVYDTPQNSCTTILLLPICITKYPIIGFAAFEMTGGWIPPLFPAPAIKPQNHMCWNTSSPCFTGFFTQKGLFAKPGGVNDFGVTAFQQTG
jgi:Flp pilus assembly protein TadG